MSYSSIVRAASACIAALVLFVSPTLGDPKPLSKEEQAKVDAAIDKGVAFLKKAQTKNGDWPRRYQGTYLAGQCALPAYALLESGVPADDPVIQKAAEYLREKCKKTCYTYDLGLAILFFDRLGDPKDKALIKSMALRLIAGQSRTGGWMYRCLPVKENQEEAFFKCLTELNNRMLANKSSVEALRDLEVPSAFRLFTVFQDPRVFDWEERGDYTQGTGGIPLVGITDNSNTQFAIIGLWAARRHQVPTDPVLRLVGERFERSQLTDGRWLYHGGFGKVTTPMLLTATRSMTCSGLLGLAIENSTKAASAGVPEPNRLHPPTLRGLTAMYQQIGSPNKSFRKRIPQEDLYYLWSVERVSMLYNLPALNDKEWYRWGAEILVANQTLAGTWPGAAVQREGLRVPTDFGPAINAAFALLFLKHSHPMKDLTSKLAIKPELLNEGIARAARGERLLEKPVTIPSSSNRPFP